MIMNIVLPNKKLSKQNARRVKKEANNSNDNNNDN